jgi:aspartate kinase
LVPNSRAYISIVGAICEDHVEVARSHIKDTDILATLCSETENECAKLVALLGAAQILDEISPKTQDTIIGTGEKLSCLFMAALLNDRGIDAEFVNLEGIITNVGRDDVKKGGLNEEFYAGLASMLGERVEACGDRLPVVTGYFGVVPGSLLASIGRGYTDLCAALLAVGVDADELQVWKEVDGIFTADPRKVPTARLIPVITPEEASFSPVLQ